MGENNEAAMSAADSIHRAMVLIAGIEMENPEDPPRLWTALEDAYDELSDALGTDGDTTADEEEAKATGRHFVVRSSGDRAKLRAALVEAREVIKAMGGYWARVTLLPIDAALAAPQRNCDVGTPDEQAERYAVHCSMFPQCAGCPCCGKVSHGKCEFAWAQMPYAANKKGGADDSNG